MPLPAEISVVTPQDAAATEEKQVTDKRIYLKVKLKSLMAEAKIIRREEQKARRHNELRDGLTFHRKYVVRPEMRTTLLAYAFLRGRSYRTTERTALRAPDWTKVRKLVERFGPVVGLPQKLAAFDAWAQEE